MGNTWTVSYWAKDDFCQDGNFCWSQFYSGESFVVALAMFIKCKFTLEHTTKLEYHKQPKR